MKSSKLTFKEWVMVQKNKNHRGAVILSIKDSEIIVSLIKFYNLQIRQMKFHYYKLVSAKLIYKSQKVHCGELIHYRSIQQMITMILHICKSRTLSNKRPRDSINLKT